jgi:nucleoside 2-deoxyribosyltransferase
MTGPKEITCLVLLPFGSEYRELRSLIQTTLWRKDITEIGLDEESLPYGSPTSALAETIQKAIERADLVIADISDGNPNIMYEVGFAHALKKTVLPIVRSDNSKVPSDLQGYLYLVYDKEDLRRLQDMLDNWLQRHLRSRRV